MTEMTVAGIALVPLIVAAVEVAKRVGLPTRWAPLVAVAVGLAASLGVQAAQSAPGGQAWVDATIVGLALGLSAAGLYSGARATVLTPSADATDGALGPATREC